MYFETECAFKPGTLIDIRFEKPPFNGASKAYRATVHWCMLLFMDEFISKYGLGVKYFDPKNFKPGWTFRLIDPDLPLLLLGKGFQLLTRGFQGCRYFRRQTFVQNLHRDAQDEFAGNDWLIKTRSARTSR